MTLPGRLVLAIVDRGDLRGPAPLRDVQLLHRAGGASELLLYHCRVPAPFAAALADRFRQLGVAVEEHPPTDPPRPARRVLTEPQE